MLAPDPESMNCGENPGQHFIGGTEARAAFIQEAINQTVDNMKPDLPLMTQLCMIKAATCRAEKAYDKTTEIKKQTTDPRIPKEVLIEEGINPNPGPKLLDTKKGKLSEPTTQAAQSCFGRTN